VQGGRLMETVTQTHGALFEQAAPILGAHLLLVEDNEINQTVAQDLLERMGLQVTIAGNGEQALELLEAEVFDAVLMDLQMPVMDGFEATRRIRAQPRYVELPVIAMTAAVLTRDREACEAAGMNDHVAKPIVPQDLLAVLLKWVKVDADGALTCSRRFPVEDGVWLPATLPGFDMDYALSLLDNNRGLFKRLALGFSQQFACTDKDMGALIASGSQPEVAALAHKIKGAAGNLGAVRLQRAAHVLETALDEKVGAGGTAHEALAELAAALAEVLASVASLDQSRTETPVAAEYDCERCDWSRAGHLMKQLRDLVDNDDFVPQELVIELRDSIGCRPLRKQLEMLGRHVEATDYERAKAILDEISCREGHDLNNRAT
jgi:two-component system sensor histidine kinase/response regulator